MVPGSRPRQARACARCAEKKLRCNKIRPSCDRCARDGLYCRYADPGRDPAPRPSTGDESQSLRDLTTLPRRLSNLGHVLSENGEGVDRHTYNPPHHSPASRPARDPGHLHLGAQTKSTYFSPTYFATLGREIRDLNRLLHVQSGYNVRRPPGPVGPTSTNRSAQSTGSASSQAREMLSDTSQQLYGDIFQTMPKTSSGRDNVFLSPEQMSLSEVASQLPISETYEVLVRAYFHGYHTMKPLFNGISFLQEADKLASWRSGLRERYMPSAHFVALYSAVMFAGCVVCPRKTLEQHFGLESRETLSSRFYDLAICAVRLAGFPKSPSLWTFAAFLILNSTWLTEEQPLNCCSFVGLAFRVAQMLGLHREPAGFKDLEAADVQVRRHLWWSLIAIDAQIALASGLPPLIESKLYHVDQPNEYSEVEIVMGQPAVTTKTVMGIFVCGRYTFYHHMSDFLRLLNSHRVTEAEVNSILRIAQVIDQDVQMRKSQISQAARLPQVTEPGRLMLPEQLRIIESSPVLASFAISVLSMLTAKPYAIMYGPLRQHGLLPYLKEKEPSAIGNCRVFLHHFLKLAQDQHLQPWHWCWPGQHQPLHSILALISELEECPEDPLADATRQLVDLGLLMCESSNRRGITSAEDNHSNTRLLSSGGVEAWNVIKRARDEVWEKLGLDADVFYCPENADDIDLEADRSQDTLFQPNACPVPNDTSSFPLVQPVTTYPVLDTSPGYLDASMAWSTIPVTGEAFPPENSMFDFTNMGFQNF